MERKQITVKEVYPPRKFSSNGKELISYSFTGEDTVKYETLSQTIGMGFMAGKVLDADVDTRTSTGGDGTVYTHYTIKQVYVDGQAVGGQRQGGGRQWSGGRSSEDRASIESQCAAKAITDLWIAGKLADTDKQVTALRAWLFSRLVAVPVKEPDVKTETKGEVKGFKAPRPVTPEELNTLEKSLKEAGKDWVWLRTQLPAEWNVKGWKALTDGQYERLLKIVRDLKPAVEPDDIPF